MAIVIDPGREHPIEIEGVKFKVTALTGRQMLELSTTLANVEQNAGGIFDVLYTCLKSWEGVHDTEGKDVPCTRENIDALPVDLAAKLFEEISKLSGLNGDDRGN